MIDCLNAQTCKTGFNFGWTHTCNSKTGNSGKMFNVKRRGAATEVLVNMYFFGSCIIFSVCHLAEVRNKMCV